MKTERKHRKKKARKSFIHEVDLRRHWPLLYWIVVPEERYFATLERVAPFVRRRSYRAGKCTPEQTRHHMRCDGKAVARLALGAMKKKSQTPLSEHFPSVGENGAGVEPSWHRSFPDARTLPVPAWRCTHEVVTKKIFFIFACANTFRSLCFICSAYYWPHYTVWHSTGDFSSRKTDDTPLWITDCTVQ